jgi:hypothetical protein
MTLRHSERGAVIIQVAVALLALTALSAFVIDYGVMWGSRGQIQTSADSGALSGAIELSLYEGSDVTAAEALATPAAVAAAKVNGVWGQSPSVLTSDVSYPPCPPGAPASVNGMPCIKVDAYRTRARGVALPTFFATLVNVNDQGVRATATAEVVAGNAVRCIKPWIVADKWIDNDESGGGWAQGDTFSPPTDTYTNPGFDPAVDTGLELVLKAGVVGTWSTGWTQEIDFGCSGSNCYRDELEGCPSWVPTVGIYNGKIACDSKGDATDPVQGCISVKTGMSQGPTSQGVTAIVNSDSGAYWDGTGVAGGCMVTKSCSNPNDVGISPRIVPIATFNTGVYANEANSGDCNGTGCVAQVTNLIGFFVEGMCSDVYPDQATRPAYCGTNAEAGRAVVGRLVKYPGQLNGSSGPTTSSFTKTIILVR